MGYLWLVCTLLAYTASSGKFVVAFITSYYICNLVFFDELQVGEVGVLRLHL